MIEYKNFKLESLSRGGAIGRNDNNFHYRMTKKCLQWCKYQLLPPVYVL